MIDLLNEKKVKAESEKLNSNRSILVSLCFHEFRAADSCYGNAAFVSEGNMERCLIVVVEDFGPSLPFCEY